jgi:ABC-type sugar transport system permease subunit
VASRKPSGLLREIRKPQTGVGYLFILPALIPTLLFLIFPMISALYLSFFDYDEMLNQGRFIGLGNYLQALTGDYLFWIAVSNTLKFAVGFVPLSIAAGFAAAVVVNRRWRGISLIRGGFYLPYLSAGVVVAFIWVWLFTPRYGLVDLALLGIGLPSVDWFGDRNLAMLVVILAATWQQAPGAMVILLAGLQGVPNEITDAARVDGAGRLDILRHITLPLLRPVTFYLIVVGVIGAMQVFDIVNITTGIADLGVPQEYVTSLVQQIYNNALGFNRMGYGSAQAILLFLAILVATYANFRFFRRDVEY